MKHALNQSGRFASLIPLFPQAHLAHPSFNLGEIQFITAEFQNARNIFHLPQ